jgi:phenylalanyl-tRNA synthetase beta chain
VLDAVRTHLVAGGLFEALTLSFVSEAQRQLIQPFGALAPVAVSHSSRSHENQLRQSLIPSLLQCRRQNERHGTMNAELFEIARVYLSAGEGKPEGTAEPLTIGMVTGRPFVQLLGLVESTVQRLAPHAALTVTPSVRPEYLPGRGAELWLNGQRLGWIAELSRDVLDVSELQDAVSAAELHLPLLEEYHEGSRSFVPLPRYPSISRDLNFVLSESVTWTQLSAVVSASGGPLLASVAFGGQYRGRQIDADRKSYVITCRFMAPDRTLTTEEVEHAVQQILVACQTQLSATLRA